MATTASDRLTPEAVWKGLRPDWLITEWGMGKTHFAAEGRCNAASSEKWEAAINQQWFEQVANRRNQLENHTPRPTPFPPTPFPLSHQEQQNSLPWRQSVFPLVLIAEPNPTDFLASVLAAALAGWNIALANPRWGTQEWTSLSQLISPNVIWGEDLFEKKDSLGKQNSPVQPTCLTKNPPATDAPAILIPTGGSSGQVKLAHHTWASLLASVTGFRQHFTPNGEPINTYCVLPVHHVSGLMQVLRAWTSNAQVTLIPFKTLETTSLPTPLRPTPQAPTLHSPTPTLLHFISLVPTQLHRLLKANKGPWLSQFQAVLLGGAPPWPTLLARAAQHHIPLYLSYGMTETAAMATAFKLAPWQSKSPPLSSGQALPHATIEIVKDGQRLAPGEIGQVVVHSSAIAQGYYTPPDQQSSTNFSPSTFYTDDLGYLSTDGHLYITGRASSKIISGGENIFPAEVEAALRSTGLVKDVCIVGQAHELWGEVVTAVYVPAHKDVSPEQIKQALSATHQGDASLLSRYKYPKCWIPQETLPRNEQGKLNRAQLLELIQSSAKSASQPNSSAVSG